MERYKNPKSFQDNMSPAMKQNMKRNSNTNSKFFSWCW